MSTSHYHAHSKTSVSNTGQRTNYFIGVRLLALLCLAFICHATVAAQGQFTCGLSFATATNFGLNGGLTPAQVAIADFNRDGNPDLVTANFYESVSILLGNGSGGFGTATTIPLPGILSPLSVGVGDFNGDNNLDIVTGNQDSDNFSLLLGNGMGGFSGPTNYSVAPGDGPRSVIVGDFNNDGDLDVATANQFSDNISVRLGNGDGTFQPVGIFGLNGGDQPFGIAVGNFNGDGNLDLVTANIANDTVSILLGNGNGTFQTASNISLGGNFEPQTVVVGDLNGDGRLDLVTPNATATNLSLLFGNGNGTFQPVINFNFNSGTAGAVIADLNGDSLNDIATADAFADTVSILINNGNSTFQPPVILGLSGGDRPVWITAGDV